MAVSIISLKCPECGATISIESDRKQAFCTYCGAKILVNNENEYVYRHIDEAQITQAETDRLIQLKQLEIAEKQAERDEQAKAFKIKLALILGAIGILMMIVGGLLGSASGDPDSWLYMIAMLGFFPITGAFGIAASFVKRPDKKVSKR